MEQRRIAVSILGTLMIVEAKNIRIQSQLVLSRRQFRDNPDDTINCEKDENAVGTFPPVLFRGSNERMACMRRAELPWGPREMHSESQ